jgi:hypothetical protein
MIAASETSEQLQQLSEQQRAHRVLGELLGQAQELSLPAIEWRLAAFEARLTGRCTAFPGPGQRRADFEAWRAVLGADAVEDASDGQTVRLTATTQHDETLVTIEITADLYDDIPSGPLSSATDRTWRSP